MNQGLGFIQFSVSNENRREKEKKRKIEYGRQEMKRRGMQWNEGEGSLGRGKKKPQGRLTSCISI